jgi:2-methylcitrate dehydratase PrpD
MTENSVATRLGAWVHGLDYDSIPQDAVATAKLLILDQLGLQLAGALLPHVQPELLLVDQLHAHPESTIAHSGHRTAASYAAFANGTLAGAGEFDDVHMFAAHIGSHVVPAALAFAETTGASGRDVITAIVAGAQVMSELGRHSVAAMVGRGWHGSKILGTFGAAATTGKLLGLDPIEIANALAIAGSDAGGGMEYEYSGGEVKRMHSGSAARLGAQAAQLAKAGLTGPLTIIEGQRGLYRLFTDHPAPAETGDIGDHFHIADTAFRMYPTIGSAATVLEGLDAILKTSPIPWDQITEVRIGLPQIAVGHGAANTHPTDAVSAQFSTAFGVGLLIVLGHANLADYMDPDLWHDARIRYIIDRVVPYAAEFEPDVPLLSAQLDVVLADGSTHHHLQSGFRGHPANPGRADAVAEKYTALTTGILGSSRSQALKQLVEHLEDEPNILNLVHHVTARPKDEHAQTH